MFDFEVSIKVQKQYMKSNRFWNQLFDRIVDDLVISVSFNSNNIWFPESNYFLLKELKNLKKKVEFKFYKSKLNHAIQLIEKQIESIQNARKQNNINPVEIMDAKNHDLKSLMKQNVKNELAKYIDGKMKERKEQIEQKLAILKDEELKVDEENLDYEP